MAYIDLYRKDNKYGFCSVDSKLVSSLNMNASNITGITRALLTLNFPLPRNSGHHTQLRTTTRGNFAALFCTVALVYLFTISILKASTLNQ